MRKVIIIIVVLLAVAGMLWMGMHFYKKSKQSDVKHETQSPEIKTIIKKTVATGSVVPRKEIDIKPQVSGIVKKIYVEPGEYVKTGDLIAKIQIIPDMVSLNNAESRLNKAKLALADAKRVYQRQKGLFEKEVISAAEFQKYELEYFSAQEELEAAENNLQLIREGITKKAGQSSNTMIRSTIDGMVLDVPVEEGNSVIETNNFNEGTTIAVIADMGEMIFEGKVDETEVGKLKEGIILKLSIGAIDDHQFDARLEYISPKGVEENGAIQFEIKAAVKLDSSYFIRAGYSANADIELGRADSVLAIEEALLITKEDSTFVEVQTGEQIFEKRLVETGLSDGIYVEIKSGLSKDDKLKVINPKADEKKEDHQ